MQTYITEFSIAHHKLIQVLTLLEEDYENVSFFEEGDTTHIDPLPDDRWVVQIITEQPIARNVIEKKVAQLDFGDEIILRQSIVADKDWVAEIKANSKPIVIGNFCVYNSHHLINDDGLTPLIVDPTRAFGSGEHYTTRSCMIALSKLFNEGKFFKNALDMGCGSAILSISMAKLWGCRVQAVDIDPQSVVIAKENVALNQVERIVDCFVSDGYNDSRVSSGAPYDIVCSNILAQPLISMAGDLSLALARGGIAILSGFILIQEEEVLNAHLAQGLVLVERIVDDGWCSLVMRKA